MGDDRLEAWKAANDDVEFAQAVQAALLRVEAPEGFADRVLARAAARDKRKVRRLGTGSVAVRFKTPGWRFGYAAAALIAISAGTVQLERVRLEHRRADVATEQFSQAMDVTHRALERVSTRLQRGEVGQFTKALDDSR